MHGTEMCPKTRVRQGNLAKSFSSAVPSLQANVLGVRWENTKVMTDQQSEAKLTPLPQAFLPRSLLETGFTASQAVFELLPQAILLCSPSKSLG